MSSARMYAGRPSIASSFDEHWHLDAETGCYIWQRCRTGLGYGSLRSQGRMVPAHRFAFEMANGPIPEGMHVLHICDNPLCVNHGHLFLGTHDDNMKDKKNKGRAQRLSGESNGRTKLTADQVVSIRTLVAAGCSKADLATQFGVTQQNINRIIGNQTWRQQ